MTASINGIAVQGRFYRREREGRQSFDGTLTVGDSDGPKLAAMMNRDDPLVYSGPAVGAPKDVRVPVLIRRLRLGTVATVVEVESSGGPL